MVTIHTSDRLTFKRCRQLWDFRSPIRMNLEPVDEHSYFSFGRSIHKGLETWYDPQWWDESGRHEHAVGRDQAITAFLDNENKARAKRIKAIAPARMMDEESTEWIERQELGTGMLRHYFTYSEANDFGVWLPVYTELPFEIPLWDGVVYKGRIDLVAKRLKDNTLWVWDHKSTASIDYGYHAPFELDPQVGSYAWAMWVLGYPVHGFLFNEMTKKAPEQPKPMRSRRKGLLFSTNKQLGCTPALYRKALQEHNEPEEPYEAFLRYLEVREDPFFRRTAIERNEREYERIGEIVCQEAEDMVDPQGTYIYPNPTRDNCRSCKFRAPCILTQEGGDASYLLEDKSQYRVRADED